MRNRTKKLHVNQHNIKANRKKGEDRPVFTIKTYNSNDYGHDATIMCPHCGEAAAELVYKPEKPMSCGAEVWIETKGDVQVECHDGTAGTVR